MAYKAHSKVLMGFIYKYLKKGLQLKTRAIGGNKSMYVITDSKGVRTLVSFKALALYAVEVIGLKETYKDKWNYLLIVMELEALGYTVDYARDSKGAFIYN